MKNSHIQQVKTYLKENKGKWISLHKNNKKIVVTMARGTKHNYRKSIVERVDTPYVYVYDTSKKHKRVINLNDYDSVTINKQTMKLWV